MHFMGDYQHQILVFAPLFSLSKIDSPFSSHNYSVFLVNFIYCKCSSAMLVSDGSDFFVHFL